MDLVDDVIDENSPLTSPTSSLTSETQNQKLLERSVSHDPYLHHPRLRSILKRSKSDGGASSECDTDDDLVYQRTRATTFSSSTAAHSEPEQEFGRRRHKSVSFLEEPIVFEIQHASKRQWKRAVWERKQRDMLRKRKSKQLEKEKEKENDTKSEMTSSTDDDKTKNATNDSETTGKQGRKTKKAEKKRNRNNSESRSEEECDNGQAKKKGKRKKKNKKGANMNLPSMNSGSDSMGSERSLKPSLNNPLIFELD